MKNEKYRIREICGDWALDIPFPGSVVTIFFNSRANAELVKQILIHEDAHPGEAVPFKPSHFPDLTKMAPITLEQLRKMDGQPVWVKVIGKTGIRCDGWCEVEIREKDPFAYVWWPGSEVEDIAKIEDYGKTWACYAYPPAHIDREAWEPCGAYVPKIVTNADRIRAMSDEELLDFMKKSVANAYMCKIMRTEPMFLTLEWLQQLAEEDT